ncbi:Ferredoxin--NAD(P)(+) reductase CarAd [Hydrogenophaga sp. T4]|nr:Ferredoxin--NAD(P)(+) reductase CarAd [Hydrogenophaga sp. T4]
MSIFDTRPKFAVNVAQTDETFPCAANESLLTGMLRLGRKGIPVGCVNGGCGVCKVRILDGDIKALGPISRAHVTREEERLATRWPAAWRPRRGAPGGGRQVGETVFKRARRVCDCSPIPQQQ